MGGACGAREVCGGRERADTRRNRGGRTVGRADREAHGARRVVACGRNPQALEKGKRLGADAVISLEQDHDVLVAAFRRELSEAGVDVVIDDLWGQTAGCVLEAISQKGLKHKTSRIRFVQVGQSAGKTITLAAATLRSSGLELLGSGFGRASLDQIMQAVREFFKVAAVKPFQADIRTAPLGDVESLWNRPEEGARLVFQP